MTELGLQKCLNNLETYAKQWDLVVSMKKQGVSYSLKVAQSAPTRILLSTVMN